jgi:DNA-binding XRE family transcriptional regulator
MTPTTSPPDELGAAYGCGLSLRGRLAAAQAEISRLKKITRCHREPDEKTLGGIIQAAREKAGMTLREAASKAGMSPSILSRIERDALAANPTLTNLRRVSDVIGKPLSELFAMWES